EITKIIRESGVINALITDDPRNVDFDKIKAYKITDAVKSVSSKKPAMSGADNHKYNVVLIDYGTKSNIVRELNKRGCNVAVVPYDTKAEDILSLDPDGIMLSNGPGDPEENTQAIEELKKLIGKKPIFAICLGHQLLALSQGAKTTKLKYGHRGVNQPVKNLKTGRTFISSQNHGYAVVSESVEQAGGKVSYINANDNTCEGIDYEDKMAFSVQFHPEACSGPHDTRFIFDKFIDMMGGNK
ncbi:MAG: carbamoyl phosphate synthase small subunit, partial [Eubacterium sp.]